MNTKRNRIIVTAVDILILSIIPLAPFIRDLMFGIFSDCFFTKYGLLCPSCGGTRCFYSFFTGDFAKAFTLNPYYFFVFIYLIVVFVWLNIAVFSKKNSLMTGLRRIANAKAVILLAILWFLFGFLRNLI